MNNLNLLRKTISKNLNLLRQIRPIHVTSAQSTKSVAPRESLNADYVLDIHYDFHYRDQIPFNAWDKKANMIADVAMGIVLAFVLYKCYSEPEHLIGDFEYPDSSKWTDEELGVPSIE
ncbi:Hypothetical protein CINCED_3A018195 [Cinara cedri]|uniref:Uncharacterized protein n=1 Tax=Cinara cedri TaxID=506608 RepID=A0A5E4NEN6_9HEMI|nr:Hypothetical protein CINCED_3A018195 [Cinara cedri]